LPISHTASAPLGCLNEPTSHAGHGDVAFQHGRSDVENATSLFAADFSAEFREAATEGSSETRQATEEVASEAVFAQWDVRETDLGSFVVSGGRVVSGDSEQTILDCGHVAGMDCHLCFYACVVAAGRADVCDMPTMCQRGHARPRAMVDSEDAAAVLRLKEDLAPLANANALAADALRTDSAAPGVLADNFAVYAAATCLPAAITVYDCRDPNQNTGRVTRFEPQFRKGGQAPGPLRKISLLLKSNHYQLLLSEPHPPAATLLPPPHLFRKLLTPANLLGSKTIEQPNQQVEHPLLQLWQELRLKLKWMTQRWLMPVARKVRLSLMMRRGVMVRRRIDTTDCLWGGTGVRLHLDAICLYIHKQTHEFRGLDLSCCFTPLFFCSVVIFCFFPPLCISSLT
jgi:hypothetical protein